MGRGVTKLVNSASASRGFEGAGSREVQASVSRRIIDSLLFSLAIHPGKKPLSF